MTLTCCRLLPERNLAAPSMPTWPPRCGQVLGREKADVNSLDDVRNTPLHRAARFGKTEVVRFLLKNKANPEPMNEMDHTPWELAKLNGNEEGGSTATYWRFDKHSSSFKVRREDSVGIGRKGGCHLTLRKKVLVKEYC